MVFRVRHNSSVKRSFVKAVRGVRVENVRDQLTKV